MLGLMPSQWRAFDLSNYDVILTSSHACVNAINKNEGQILVSYCHTPMRYAWEWRTETDRFPIPVRWIWPAAAAQLRRADLRWSKKVDLFLANSRNVADRISRYYGREAQVLHPPIDTTYWSVDPRSSREDYYLVAGRLVPYKRPEVAVKAANIARLPLVVAGSGPQLDRLRRIAGPTVRFVVQPTRAQLRELYRRARAYVFPGIEDFGMTMVEAQACGTPVIAYGEGGAKEAVYDGVTGQLYSGPNPEHLADVMGSFDESSFNPKQLRAWAERFKTSAFQAGLREACASLFDGAGIGGGTNLS